MTVVGFVNHAFYALRLVSLSDHSAVALACSSDLSRRLLLHGSGASVGAGHLVGARRLLLSCLAVANTTLVLLEAVGLVDGADLFADLRHIVVVRGGRVRSLGNQGGSDEVDKHGLAVQLELERLSLVNHLVDALAQVARFEVSACDRAGVLLASIIISVDTLVIVEVNVVNVVFDFDLVTALMLHRRHLAHAMGDSICVHQAVLQD